MAEVNADSIMTYIHQLRKRMDTGDTSQICRTSLAAIRHRAKQACFAETVCGGEEPPQTVSYPINLAA